MDSTTHNLFDKNLGLPDPYRLELELKLYNVKEKYNLLQAKVLAFYQELERASHPLKLGSNVVEEWREKYFKHFDIQIHTNGTTEG